MFELGTKEIIIVAAVALFVFGGKKIPELTKGLTDSVRNIRGALSDDVESEEDTPVKSKSKPNAKKKKK